MPGVSAGPFHVSMVRFEDKFCTSGLCLCLFVILFLFLLIHKFSSIKCVKITHYA